MFVDLAHREALQRDLVQKRVEGIKFMVRALQTEQSMKGVT